MRGLLWKKGHWGELLSGICGLSFLYFSKKCSVLIFICILLLPGGHNGEARTTSKNKVLLKSGRNGWKTIFLFFFYLEATKHSPFHVVSSWFLVFLSPGITVSSHSYSFMLSLHFFRSHVRNIMKLLT